MTLAWSAGDAEGLASGRLEYAKVNGSPTTGCGSLLNPSWTPITTAGASVTLMGATSWADSLSWTVPSSVNGYFCVRGSVTDLAGQTTVIVNPFGIR